MSMTMRAYTNSSESGVVDKQISYIGEYEIRPTDAVDIEKPTFIIRYSADLIDCNYIYVQEYKRYYYAWITTKPGNEAIINCLSDPLKSFWEYAKNCDILATRAESIGQPTHYKDSMLPVYPSKKNVTSIVMPHSAAPLSGDLSVSAENCYLLTVLGGEPNVQGGEV